MSSSRGSPPLVSEDPRLVRRRVAYERFDAATRLPLLLLALALIPLLLWPELNKHLSPGTRSGIDGADYAIWAAFTFEYVVKLILAPARWRYVRGHIPDLVLVVVPVLRPLRLLRSVRALRLLRLGRVAAAASSGGREAGRSLAARSVTYALLLAALLLVVTSAVVLDVERDAPGSNIHTLGDAVWWAVTTVTTVGYGDHYPVTVAGRAVASALMLGGLCLLAVVTAGFASWFVSTHRPNTQDEAVELAGLRRQVEELAGALTRIERMLLTRDGPPQADPAGRQLHQAPVEARQPRG